MDTWLTTALQMGLHGWVIVTIDWTQYVYSYGQNWKSCRHNMLCHNHLSCSQINPGTNRYKHSVFVNKAFVISVYTLRKSKPIIAPCDRLDEPWAWGHKDLFAKFKLRQLAMRYLGTFRLWSNANDIYNEDRLNVSNALKSPNDTKRVTANPQSLYIIMND